ncbi:MAG: carbamoyltransferase HypF [Elusimicrobiota bacterium]
MNKSIFIKGTVQGVGFRPFVYRLAKRFFIKGRVKNTGSGVYIEARGRREDLDNFIKNIKDNSPDAADITGLEVKESKKNNFSKFEISESSGKAESGLNIPPDIALCDECLREIKDSSNSRYKYPFTSCLNCGQRFTIVNKLPYDRKNTQMSEFKMCDRCRKEYNDVDNRRYHAQPISCPDCGPGYEYKKMTSEGFTTELLNPVKKAADSLKNSQIMALKGWGGFHIVGDAENPEVIKKIRKIKQRSHKPLAVMARDKKAAEFLCGVNRASEKILKNFRRPILLLPKRGKKKNIEELIAPDNPTIGLMLPYSAVHHLLFEYSGLKLLIFTSLNLPSVSTIKKYEKAREFLTSLKISGVSMLDHNLKIHNRCDDSVVKNMKDGPIILRRSRGYVPQGIEIPHQNRVLTSGAEQNVNICFTKSGKAYPSQYIGNVDNTVTENNYIETIQQLDSIWNYNPRIMGCDLHPGYVTTKVFKKLSAGKNLPLYKIQHHHAHLAGCAAENNLKDSPNFMGVALDGAGYGKDGKIWGGEFMRFSYKNCTRLGSFRPVSLPGGDMAAIEPWRMAVSYLKTASIDWRRLDNLKGIEAAGAVAKLIDKNLNCPKTSSAGRLFDAVSSIIGLVDYNTYRARAPIALEGAVDDEYLNEKYNFNIIEKNDKFIIDTLNLIECVFKDKINGVSIGRIGARFHSTVAEMVVRGLMRMSKKLDIKKACLSGGVFCNYYLSNIIRKRSKKHGLEIYTHRKVSPNDNGISYGQAVITGQKEK